MGVFVSDEQSVVPLDLARCVRLATLTLAEERVPSDAEVSLIFVDEASIADLNRRFLDGASATDVLAFPIDDDALPGGRRPDEGGRGPGSPPEADDPPIVLGDVVICPSVAARQAPEHEASFDDELALLVVHGILHLLNYDHAEEREAQAMRRRERELLERFRQSEES
ncbi:MAG TPA: rRNA maturation RNase YbeY [Acidimicrobiia bacterium]|nr:rRNA maturation RNase YbeY [Acidimicrobiia bacterium]